MNRTSINFYDMHSPAYSLNDEVMQGLNASPRFLSPKLFYDLQGSQLFDAICSTPEYYLTRTEEKILQDHATDIINALGKDCLLIELGSGNCHKVRHLLGSFQKVVYMPVDISSEHLKYSSKLLAQDFPEIPIHAVCMDYCNNFDFPEVESQLAKVVFFPGSSISNFEPHEAIDFLKKIVAEVRPNGGLLIGVDLKKESKIINAAYNDKQGMTAAFNLNILRRINRELNANFQLNNFTHHAFYNDKLNRLEMHLISSQPQYVAIGEKVFRFSTAESLHTENSYKYSIEEFKQLAYSAGFQTSKLWVDKNNFFCVYYFSF